MDYQMRGGYTLSDEDLDRLGDACARGEYPGAPGRWVVRPRGGSETGEELVRVSFKVSRSQAAAIDAAAAAVGQKRSQFLREAARKAVTARPA